MCMDPASFMPDKPSEYECYTSNSDDPAVEADCPDECLFDSYLDEVDGTVKYHCYCEVSSVEECAEKYPGEQAAEQLCHGWSAWV